MKLRKNNGQKEEWQLRNENILMGFRGSDEWGEYLAGFPLENALRHFITSPKGLASSFEEGEFDGLMEMVRGNETTDYRDLDRKRGEYDG